MAVDHLDRNRDRLSDLPDDILVSFLPINQAARCSVIASRWPRIFLRTLVASLSTRRPAP
jgi:hypothetical protein